MAETVSEKVIRLETQMLDNKTQLNRVESKVDSLITKVDGVNLLQIEMAELRKEITELKHHRGLTSWLFPTLSAAAGAIMALLVNIALTRR